MTLNLELATTRLQIAKENGYGYRTIHVVPKVLKPYVKGLAEHLSYILTPLMSPNSFGAMRNRSTVKALKQITNQIKEYGDYILKIDIKDFFESIDLYSLNLMLENTKRFDKTTLTAINELNSSPYYDENWQLHPNLKGLKQGLNTSPILANFYLNNFDKKMESLGFKYTRYLDDIIIVTPSLDEAETILKFVENELNILNLFINQEKTQIAKYDSEELNILRMAINKDLNLDIPLKQFYKAENSVKENVKEYNNSNHSGEISEKIGKKIQSRYQYYQSLNASNRYEYIKYIVWAYLNYIDFSIYREKDVIEIFFNNKKMINKVRNYLKNQDYLGFMEDKGLKLKYIKDNKRGTQY